MLTDTHCHLADPAYDADRGEVLDRAWAAGVTRIVVIGESPLSADRALELTTTDSRLSTTAGSTLTRRRAGTRTSRPGSVNVSAIRG